MHLHAENPTARQALDTRLPAHRGLYYGGDWHDSVGGRQASVVCPSTGDSLGSAIEASSEDVDRAVKAARAAFPRWRDTPAQDRAKAIHTRIVNRLHR